LLTFEDVVIIFLVVLFGTLWRRGYDIRFTVGLVCGSLFDVCGPGARPSRLQLAPHPRAKLRLIASRKD
jgi:hypothetical protein